MEFLIFYILGLLLTLNACLIWFYSPLKVTLGQLFFNKDIYTHEEFETYLLISWPVLGKLLSCYICFSFWCSVVLGLIGVFAVHMPCIALVFTAGTYPALAYLYKTVIDRS